MLLLLHSLTRKRCKMPRQARKLSGMGILQGVWCRHSPAGKTDGYLIWNNTKIVAKKMISRIVPMISLYILMSMASCMYAQGNCQKVSPMKILQKERVKEFSFTMYYHTRTMNHKYGNIYLKGCIKHGTTRLYLNKLQDSNRKKAKWVKHYFNTSVIMIGGRFRDHSEWLNRQQMGFPIR